MATGRNLHGMDTSYDGSGNLLRSKMFTLFVGPEKHQFYSHAAVLSRSPVLERMCSGLFKESAEQHIELPDDDADVFGCMLEYLYTGVVHGFETSNQGSDAAVLADVYIMAEKYQLSSLKELLLTPMAVFLDSANDKERVGCFFDCAIQIYHNTPDSDVLFQDFFKISVTQLLDGKVLDIEADIKRCLSEGGKLARDTFDAYYKHMSTEHETEAHLRKKYRDLKTNHRKLETSLASFKKDSRSSHRRCYYINDQSEFGPSEFGPDLE